MIYLIQLALSILCNLLQVPANVAYFMNTTCDRIVQCYTNSTDPKIRILSASILCYLEPKFTLNQYHLELKNEDVKFMIDLVLTSISEYSIIFYLFPLLRALHMIVKISESNAQKFISQGLVSIFSKLIATSDSVIQSEVILILWTLALYSTEMIKSEINLLQIVESLKGSDDHRLATASMCTLWDINEQLKGT